MPLKHDTYHRNVLLGASRRRREDAEELLTKGRWIGSMYLGGYAVECALKALICYNERKTNFKDTRIFVKSNITGNQLHNLGSLLNFSDQGIQNAIQLDRTNKFKSAWNIITREWRHDQLRYYDKNGNQQQAESFVTAVKVIHDLLLHQQGES